MNISSNVVRMGIDLGKSTFHVCGMDSSGQVILRKKFSHNRLHKFMASIHTSHECNPCWRNQSQFECFNHSPFSSTKGAIFYIPLSHGAQRGGFGSTGDGRKSVVDSACFVDFAAFGRRFRTFVLWTLRIVG